MAEKKSTGGGDSSEEPEEREGERPVEERVEEEARELSERLTRWIGRSAVRAREELEDIWAEAQNIRRGR